MVVAFRMEAEDSFFGVFSDFRRAGTIFGLRLPAVNGREGLLLTRSRLPGR